MIGIQQSLEPISLLPKIRRTRSTKTAVEPETCADSQCAPATVFVQCKQKLQWMHKVRILSQKLLPLPQRLTNLCKFTLLQVSQTAMNQPRRSASCAGAKILLLDQECLSSRPRALT